MEKTRTDPTQWLLAIYLVAHDKRGISAYQLSEEISVTYKKAWLTSQNSLSYEKTDKEYTLAGIVELDDAFLVLLLKVVKRGRRIEKTKVLVGLAFYKKTESST